MSATPTTKELEFLREHSASMSIAAIAEALGMSYSWVRHARAKYGLSGRREGVHYRPVESYTERWTEEDLGVLQDLAGNAVVRDIAGQLRRTESAVRSKMSELGITGMSKKEAVPSGSDSRLWRGGHLSYTRNWQQFRTTVFERDEYMCRECGLFSPGTHLIYAHHIIPLRIIRENILRCCVTLCATCHVQQKAHHWKEEEYNIAFLDTLPLYQQIVMELV